MKRVTALAGSVMIVSLIGCASTQQRHDVSKDGVPIYCTSVPAQGDSDCDSGAQNESNESASPTFHYKAERDSQPPPPFDPGPIPNFDR
jgi:hypothetical protein